MSSVAVDKVDSGMAGRVQAMRERALSLVDSIPRGERLLLYTESFQRTEGEPEILRRAKAFTHYLCHVTVRIFPEDQLAGLPQRRVVCHQGLSPHDNEWWCFADFPEVWGSARTLKHPDLPEALREAAQWWADQDRPPAWPQGEFSEEIRRAIRTGLFNAGGSPLGHALPGHAYVLRAGLRQIAENCREGAARADEEEKRVTWEAMAICAEAAIEYAARYARLAEQLADEENDAERAAELSRMAEACRRVPAEPPRSFREALQMVWFVHRLDEMEQGDATTVAHSFGRLDQYLFPYYEQDVAAGTLTRNEAKRLLTEFYLKLYRYYSDQHIMIGGQRPDGCDGCNDLTELILEVAAEQRLLVDIGARVHEGTPDWFWKRWAEVVPLNLGHSLFGDGPIIEGLTRLGIPPEAAREYAVVGCMEVLIPGYLPSRTLEHNFSPTKCLELALNRGRCAITGEQVGPMTQAAAQMCTMDDVWEAFATQFREGLRLCVEATNLGEECFKQRVWLPFQSCTYEAAVERGLEVTHGGATRNLVGVAIYNVAHAADGLAAIEEVVFEKKACSLQELCEALQGDFAEAEGLRRRLLAAPKYGNGNPTADRWAGRIVDLYAEELAKCRNSFGEPFMPMVFAVTMQMINNLGPKTGPTPDGRHAGAPLAASLDPAAGADRNGPTAAMRSICAIDHSKLAGGTGYILELHPSALGGPDATENLASLLRTFFQMGGSNLAINLTTPETLRCAQADPERHRSLSVRVFGYSDYFVNLDRDLQEYIIAKYSHRQEQP